MLDIDLNCPPSVGSDVPHQFFSPPAAETAELAVVVANDRKVEKQKRKICGELERIEPERRNERSLELLIEAARYVEGFENSEKLSLTRWSELSESTRGEKRCLGLSESTRSKGKEMEVGNEGEEEVAVESLSASSPVVRSKRGRSQALPTKYRDSVMEPLSQLTRSDRSVPVPTKRRSR